MESVPENKTPILVVDDDEGLLLSIKATLACSGMPEPALVSDSRRVMELVQKGHFRLVLLDLIMPHLSGMDILQKLKQGFPTIECVLLTTVDEIPSALKAMRFGAYDYLVKPLQSGKMIIVINNALERYSLRHGLALFERKQQFSDFKNPMAFKHMVAEDDVMALVFHQAEIASTTDDNLVITGEPGSGKEILARTIHELSDRSSGPFVGVNMAAFGRRLFEDDVFGHTKGAYTGAQAERRGFFKAAQGGTLFLDEITELVPELQGKLLRVIEERELYRLGSTEIRDVNVRLIAATNRDISKEIKEGRFHEDLIYRLNRHQINIPPLRERKKDILPLAHHFLKLHAKKNSKKIDSLSKDLAYYLLSYPFPCNVRELENIIATAVLLEKGNVLTLSSARGIISSSASPAWRTDELFALAELEKRHILRVLEATDGNRTRAAKILGIALRTLQRKLKAFNESAPSPK
jgi:DNA-binding NtrC family response regulator